ncbi:glycosaminoglycan xylosylkinase homolog isoform X1 [Anopheles bellator]|uniref:glycosaminoglycan xylosylkinase homolog isoform X1 n=1 Tax=Anopheles bellator TaxID=139047 RepID=UPI0026499DC4|nr:glycosaminoglycan xylosylkinase homolog isoform X1 [Anopheles bellator]
MTKCSFYDLFILLCLSLAIFCCLNVYFISHLQSTTLRRDGNESVHRTDTARRTHPTLETNARLVHKAIIHKATSLKPDFRNKNPKHASIKQKLVGCFRPKSYNSSNIWKMVNSWAKANEVFPALDNRLGSVLEGLRTEPIISIKSSRRGTQLKLVLELPGSQYVLFKPNWYRREEIINGTVYSGKDRHNSEIVSFHLAAILNLRFTPIVVGRRISLRDHVELADDELRRTMPVIENRQCVFGTCHYCKRSEPVCDDVETGRLEGAVLHTIPGKLVKYRSPWQRTYNSEVMAEWEKNNNYCSLVKQKLTLNVLLDLMDASIFDFLIQNGDRHHYETREDRLLLLDNGKGFGNPFIDHMDILAPLYQCCVLRRSTWNRLILFSGGALTESLRTIDELDAVHPLLTEDHYHALERRLLYVYSTVELCKQKYGKKMFK